MLQISAALVILLSFLSASSGVKTGYRGRVFYFVSEPPPFSEHLQGSFKYYENGILVVDDTTGLVSFVGQYGDHVVCDKIVEDYMPYLLMPGFIDCHVHYVQTRIIASYGQQLLQWLSDFVFPEEQKFSRASFAQQQASSFLDVLLASGTTSANVFAATYPISVSAFYKEAQMRRMRVSSGKTWMDRNAPKGLLDQPQTAFQNSVNLAYQWNGVDRLHYGVTPRFAITCSADELQLCGKQLQSNQSLLLHTHLAENRDAVQYTHELFPDAKNYVDVYAKRGLVTSQSVFAHGIWLDEDEWATLASAGSSIAHCPTSNLFLGSGLFNLTSAVKHGVNVCIGTDVGAGTSLSMLKTLNEAYKVQQLQGVSIDAFALFYMATLGGARAMHIDQQVGTFHVGSEADFIVLASNVTKVQQQRMQQLGSGDHLGDELFMLATLGDERNIFATHILGRKIEYT